MLDRTIISYTRSVLKSSLELVEKLGQFEVYYGKAGKEPAFNYIVTRIKRSKANDPVQAGFFYADIHYLGENQEPLIEAANLVESLLDELVFPGGGAVRMYLRDLDYFDDEERKKTTASMLFSFRGVNF